MTSDKILKSFALLVFIVAAHFLTAQEDEFDYPLVEQTYLPNIQSSKFYNLAIRKERPIWIFNGQHDDQKLKLVFDDMDADTKDYAFSIVHATADWQQTDLDVTEYSHGYLRTEIEDYTFSIQTKVSYTTYSYDFDVDNIPWFKSGNYLLVVWDITDDEEQIAFTKRFFVIEQNMILNINSTLPILTGSQRTHQAFELSVDLKGLKVFNPQNELYIGVYQNMRWDNPLVNLTYFHQLGDVYYFGKTDQISFPGVAELRSLDIRSAKFRSADIALLERYDDRIEVLAEIDYPRYGKEYLFTNDRNGTYFFENHDRKIQAALRMEYIEVLFTLQLRELYGHKIYVTGPHISWELRPEYEMVYDENRRVYFAEALIKQGYYDYTYVTVDEETNEKSITAIEGSSFKVDNDYLFFFYHRSRSDRYDRIVGAKYYSNLGGPLTIFDIK